jgi:hypothetical protein
MRSTTIAAFLTCSALTVGGTALGGEGVQVNITNDGIQDVMVTVYDMNVHPRRMVLTNARINGFTSVPLSLIADESGHAKLAWTATSLDPKARKCGQASAVAGNDGTVNVHADTSCGSA